MTHCGTFEFYVELHDGSEEAISVEWRGYYDEGRIDGPPERCYPPEGEIVLDYQLPADAHDSAATLHAQIEQRAWDKLMGVA